MKNFILESNFFQLAINQQLTSTRTFKIVYSNKEIILQIELKNDQIAEIYEYDLLIRVIISSDLNIF